MKIQLNDELFILAEIIISQTLLSFWLKFGMIMTHLCFLPSLAASDTIMSSIPFSIPLSPHM